MRKNTAVDGDSDDIHDEEVLGEEIHDDDTWFCKSVKIKSSFPQIDRKQEDKDVDEFQKTNNIRLFEKVYDARIPTLKYWARKYHYLMDSKDDMFGEFGLCFTKSVYTYKKHKGPFNTYLYRLLLNCVQNLQTGRKAKKRLPEGVDPNCIGKILLSLDYSYDGKDGSGNTLKDIVADKMASKDNVVHKMITDETLDAMSGRDQVVKGFLRKLSDGNTIASLLKEYKMRHGKIRLSKSQIRNLSAKSKKAQRELVSFWIKNHGNINDDFSIVAFNLNLDSNKLHYTIEMKKTAEADLVMKTIRKLRKDKKIVMSRLAI